jgi:arsenite methyltransferase
VNCTMNPEVRDRVREAYSAVGKQPAEKHPFPVGRRFAESLGYPAALLDSLPSTAVEAFAGVSNVSLFAEIPEGATVLDLGCGAGLDSLVAGRRVGPNGKVVGLDFSETMLQRARAAADEGHADNVTFEKADAERLPISDGSINIALVNGIFNLNLARESIFRELARVLGPGGMAYAAELILAGPLPPEIKHNEADWFA